MEKVIQKPSISLIGTGRVSHFLASRFSEYGFKINQIVGRSEPKTTALAKKVEAKPSLKIDLIDLQTDYIIIAVSDDSLSEVIQLIPKNYQGIVAHTSGIHGLEIIKHYFEKAGVFYPLQSFSDEHIMMHINFPILIDGSDSFTKEKLVNLASYLNLKGKLINETDKKKLHLAAVFANNFTNHLISISEKLCEKESLDFNLLLPLLKETISKIEQIPSSKRQTGPAIRGDLKTINTHLKLLEENPRWQEIYLSITKDIQHTYLSIK